MPSFDIVSKVQMNEVDNALHQAQKEIGQRFDFKDTGTELEKTAEGIVVRADSEGRVEAAIEVLKGKLVKRNVPLKNLEQGELSPGPKGSTKVLLKIIEGISVEKAREIVKHVKETKLKVQASIQDDQVRVTGKARDDLQSAIRALRAHDFGVELQYINFRE
ncbi:MAG: YajQ family cyclic di-GMP-binding protein [Deltaproteobacteria bacterium]|nr:YajQ family cyclic di-GMP-binding protein [Deltaproteobacteria bacterium]